LDDGFELKTEKNNENEIVVSRSSFNKLLFLLIAASVVSAFLGGYAVGTLDGGSDSLLADEIKDIISELEAKAPAPQPAQSQSQPSTPPVFQVSLDDVPVKGDPNAPITIIEFSDFQCPFCKKFHATTLPLLEKNYIDTGKVKFVYRDFPIKSIHPNAASAALASECADDQNLFWKYHDLVFENQRNWEGLSKSSAVNVFKQYASELGIDMDEFNQCFETAKHLTEVNGDLQDGVSYGVTGTPGFFVGNDELGYVKIIGAQPYSVFERLIEDQTARLDI